MRTKAKGPIAPDPARWGTIADGRRVWRVAFGAALALALLPGCARMQRVEHDVRETRKEVAAIMARIDTLSKAVDDLNINTGGATNKMRADLTTLIRELGDRLDRLAAELDESQYRMEQMEKKVDALRNQRLVVTSDSTAAQGDSAAPGKLKVVEGLDVEKLYQQAREDYITGKYDLALKGFGTVYEKDVSEGFKDNALYWMAESHNKMGNPQKAVEYYNRCVSEFPMGSKVCASLFKIGLIHDKANNRAQRDVAWRALEDRCPSSNEAHRAKEIMNP